MRTIQLLAAMAVALAACALETGPVDPAFTRSPGTPGGICYTGCEH